MFFYVLYLVNAAGDIEQMLRQIDDSDLMIEVR